MVTPWTLLSTSSGRRRGRPRKFQAPSRAVTLTLPEHVIDALGAIDPDLSRAVVRLTQPELAKRPHAPAELAAFGQRAVIVVNPTRTLEQRTGISLVPLPDGRALISFERLRHHRRARADDRRCHRRPPIVANRSGDLQSHRRDPARGPALERRHAAPAEHHRARISPAVAIGTAQARRAARGRCRRKSPHSPEPRSVYATP